MSFNKTQWQHPDGSIYTVAVKDVDTYTAEICMAGDIDQAVHLIRKHVFKVGLCVTIDETKYIYTGGMEDGFKIRLIHYPRFETNDVFTIFDKAVDLANLLMVELSQTSYTIITPEKTYWFTRRPSDVKELETD